MRAARTGTRARRAASPAAASASCHSESTRAQPSACVMIMYVLPSSCEAAGGSDRAPAPWRSSEHASASGLSGCTKLFVPTPGRFWGFPVDGKRVCRMCATDLGSTDPLPETCSPLCVCASSCGVILLTQVLFSVHLDELEEIRERQRPDQQSQDPEIRYAGERTDEGDEGVNVRPAAEHHRSQDVVDIPHEQADQCDERGGARTVADEQRDGRRHPD